MRISNNLISIFLVLLATFSFFIGFSLDEVSMGAGGYEGDLKFVKKSIRIFSENSTLESILLYSESSNRPPLIYILHKLFNPFSANEEAPFRKTVFLISIGVPILFWLCLKRKFKNEENNLLILLLSSIIFFNPF